MDKASIPLVLGTNRDGRRSEKVAGFLVEELGKREDAETKFFDVADFNFPKDNYGEAIKDNFPEWRDTVKEADGLIIVAPEYNHGYPGPLKTLLDTLLPEYDHKAVGIAGVSSGAWGGTRVIENLIPVVHELGLVVAGTLNFPNMKKITDNDLRSEESRHRANVFFDEIVWMAKTLKWGRENVVYAD